MDENLWVFGYGSLMWRPDFEFVGRYPATLYGWHRAMCILSTVYRGRPGKPGLVLGLDRGGSCRGLAFQIAAAGAEEVRKRIFDREMITGVYRPRFAPARLADGRTVPVYIFTVRKEHEQYAGGLSPADTARLIRQGHGESGSSRDYLARTVENMTALGIVKSELHNLLARVDGKNDSI